MAEEEIDKHLERHFHTLYSMHSKGEQSLRKTDANLLMNRGLIEPAGPRGQFGMTYYKLTESGSGIARNINLSGGQLSHVPGSAPEPTPAPGPDDPVEPGYMRMKNGKVLKVANHPRWQNEG